MRKNHDTTTLIVAMAAIAATLLAAGTVAALGSNHSAFAHKEYKKTYDKYNKYGKQGRDGDNIAASKQYLKCLVIGGEDGMKKIDGEKQRQDLVTATPTPTPTGNGPGITGNSCNNEGPTNTNNDGSNNPGNDARTIM